ncbi:MAG: hypothetical protein ABI561_28105 [Bradyrhizobium sp.]
MNGRWKMSPRRWQDLDLGQGFSFCVAPYADILEPFGPSFADLSVTAVDRWETGLPDGSEALEKAVKVTTGG